MATPTSSPEHLSPEHLFSGHLSSTAAQSEMTQPESLQRFTRFSRLPPELRAAIWDLTLLPRTVDIHVRKVGTLKSLEMALVEMYSPMPVPVALQVSRESRARAQRCYKLCFGTRVQEPHQGHGTFAFVRPACTYFSYEMDVARFRCAGILKDELPVTYLTPRDLEGIRHIRTDWCTTVSARLIRQLTSFEQLESFTLSWCWRGGALQSGKSDDLCRADVYVHESTYGLLHDRPDIAQFMGALVTARDVFAPGYRLPMLRVRSISPRRAFNEFISILNNLINPNRPSS